MNKFSGSSLSYWNERPSIPHHEPLRSSPSVDVCIVGAGIAGLTAAYLLLRAGKSVVVLEQGQIAGGDTGRTTAHLSPVMDDGLTEIEKWHGRDGARLVARSHSEAIDYIERIVAEEKIDCDFARVDGYLWSASQRSDDELHAEFAAAQRAKIEVEWVDHPPGMRQTTSPALRFPRQAQFHVTKYLKALAHKISELGGKIYDGTHVHEIVQGPTVVIKSGRHHVKAQHVIEAANSLVSGSARTITKLYPYRTFAIAAELPAGSIAPALWWDTEDPYHYARVQASSPPEMDLLIVGGEDHKTGQANDADVRFDKLETWARSLWPQMGQVRYRWSGQVLETPDGLALIGQNPGNRENSYLISGDSGHGVTHGTLGAMILTDAILGKANPYRELYAPGRLRVSALKPWIEENANVAKQYLDWIAKSEVPEAAQIAPGEGAVLTQGLSKIAAYRDVQGKLHACSAVCTHLGGIVRWNGAEKTWDCPCHGSRFDAFGKVIATPAVDDLEPRPL